MAHESTPKFDEKILYKTHQHWIVPVLGSIKYIAIFALPIAIVTYFISDYSWMWTSIIFLIVATIVSAYDHYLWEHSWLFIGNQKVTLSVRNGIFSQYAMNVRYRNIRDCAVSKHSMWSFLFKYGTIFIRSSANEGDFRANFVPKVGKVYALVNALSRYNDEERAQIESIEALHSHHTNKEFSTEARETLHTKNH
jgi:membrane protein YdbS with pleckstrin-like domain